MKTLAAEHWPRYGIENESDEADARDVMRRELLRLGFGVDLAREMIALPAWPTSVVSPLAAVVIEELASEASA